MKIKALLSLTGAVTMHPGEERTVSNETGQDLVQAGLAICLDEPEPAEEPKEEVKEEPMEEPKAKQKPPKEKAAAKEA